MARQFSDEERAAILERSRELLSYSVPDTISEPELTHEQLLQEALAQPLETRNQRDARELEEQQERRAMQRWRLRESEAEIVHKTSAMDAATQAQWDAWATAHVTRALAERDAFWREVHGEVLATERQKTDAKLKRLRTELELKIDALAAELNKQRAVQDGSISDLLPPRPQRKRNAA